MHFNNALMLPLSLPYNGEANAVVMFAGEKRDVVILDVDNKESGQGGMNAPGELFLNITFLNNVAKILHPGGTSNFLTS